MRVQAGARCATHGEVAAVDVCKRCGKFLCGECVELVGEDAYCAECAARLPRGAARLSKASAGLSAACWVLLVLGARLPIALALLPAGLSLVAFALALVATFRHPKDLRWTLPALGLSLLFLLLMVLVLGYRSRSA